MREFIDQMADLQERNIDAALCMIVRTEGSTPLKAGASMLVRADGTTTGTVGGGALEQAVIAQALEAIADDRCGLFTHRLVRDHNMCCGGTVEVFIKSLPAPDRLYIFGAGHIGSALAKLCEHLFSHITVIDDRPGVFDDLSLSNARCINAPPGEVLPTLRLDKRSYVVIATYSHPLDREILRHCIRLPLAYCGMIGSGRKLAVTRMLFAEQRWATAEQLDSIDMPIGIAIGAETPGEIAVSIAARLVERRHRIRSAAGPTRMPAPPDIAACIPELRA